MRRSSCCCVSSRKSLGSDTHAADLELEPARLEPRVLLLEIRRRERIAIEPAFGKAYVEEIVAGCELDLRELVGATTPVQQHRET